MPGLSDVLSLTIGSVQTVPGWAQVITVPDPVPGALTVGRTAPGETWERIRLARAVFTADATVVNRFPRVEIVDPNGLVLFAADISAAIAASGVVTAYAGVGVANETFASGACTVGLPDFLLQSGFTVRFAHDGLGAADSWSGARFYVARYPTNIVHSAPGA